MGSLRPASGRFQRGRVRILLGLGALILTLAVGPTAAYAATITVTTTADELNADGDCSLREAIQAANTNTAVDACPAGQPGPIVDVITFGVTGTIALGSSGQLTITDDLTITGPGASSLTISGNGFDTGRVMEVTAGTTLNLSGVTIANGRWVSAPTIAGAGILNHGTLAVTDSAFSANDAGGGCCSGLPGGAIGTSGGSVVVTRTTFSGNGAGGPGGGIYSESGPVTVRDSAFVSNSSNEWGGAIFNNGSGPVIVTGTTFTGNSAVFGGGGIFSFPGGTLTVSDSTFSGNSTSAAVGGAIANYAGTLSVTNATFWQNSARFDGGAINNREGIAVVANSTFSGNSAGGSGGALWNAPWTPPEFLTLKNTIVADSPSGGNCSGTFADGGGNLSWPDATCPGISVDPLLDPAGLQDNGGPTQTIALQPGSPAIDAAVACPPPATDQRGVVRPQGAACDIGAFELETALRIPQHFLRYQLNQPEALGETVTLVDRFGTLTVRLEEAEWLMNPAEKLRQGRDPEPIQRLDEHLVCYGLPYMTTADRTVAVENQFVHSTLRIGRPLTLCTPASKALEGDPGPPPDDLDHFVCYDVRGETPLFPSETLVTRDQFGERTIRIDRARELCTPAEKRRGGHDPEPVQRPGEQLVCYRITTQTPSFPALRVVANDQFNSLQTLRVRTLERLCVPSA
jgi:CSLREA domain-containing protein